VADAVEEEHEANKGTVTVLKAIRKQQDAKVEIGTDRGGH
jgi:hypothetical protein